MQGLHSLHRFSCRRPDILTKQEKNIEVFFFQIKTKLSHRPNIKILNQHSRLIPFVKSIDPLNITVLVNVIKKVKAKTNLYFTLPQ